MLTSLEAPAGLQDLLLQFAKEAVKQQARKREKAAAASRRPLKVIIAGAPASGKGTQAARIVAKFGLVHISVGDLLRFEVAAGSTLGLQAKEHMESGGLVPDDLVTQLVSTRLQQQDVQQQGWLLDGYPRTEAQCQALAAAGIRPDAFICIEVPDAVLVDRVAGRRMDPQTGEIYHLVFKPPPPEIQHRLVQRPDDTEETVRTRIINFKLHTGPVKLVYQDRLAAVDGDRPEGAVWEDVERALQDAAAAVAACQSA